MASKAKSENPNATRRSLLSRVKNPDDQESWRDFFGTYSKLIYSVAHKAGLTHSEAEEVVQETFISLTKKMPQFKYDPAIGSFKSFLIHTTHFKISDQFRKRNRRHLQSPSTASEGRTAAIERIPDPSSLNVATIFEGEWREHLFQRAIERIKQQVTASQYQIFDLYVLKEWPVRKVAATLGINRGRIYLAKHRLSQLVKREVKALEADFRVMKSRP